MAEDTRGLARKGALASRDVRCRSVAVHVTGIHWVRRDIAMDSEEPRQYSWIVREDIDGGHLETEERQCYYSDASSRGQAENAGRVECSCRNALAHRHEGLGHRGLAGFYYHAGPRRRVREGEAVAAAVGRCEEAVAE